MGKQLLAIICRIFVIIWDAGDWVVVSLRKVKRKDTRGLGGASSRDKRTPATPIPDRLKRLLDMERTLPGSK